MKLSRQPAGFMAILALAFALILGSGVTRAQAAAEDVAMFYDDLSQYGQWAEYGNYGPVWRPNQVSQDWRPYTDGRWAPTDNGYVFETQEPWGWATYHYGNWMPTQDYGWVWVPGRTWYPSTVQWRTSPEDAAPDDSYVGWAPMPPENYVPPEAPPQMPPQEFAAPSPSYYQGNPAVDALTAPFWIFVKAASFLLGMGQPYAPSYSYAYSGALVPQPYVQVFYPQTVIVQRYYTPSYYPPAYFRGHRHGYFAYNWGPPPSYFYRRARINQAVFDRALHNNSIHISRIHNVVPPSRVMNRYGYIRQIMPPALTQGRRLPAPHRVTNYRTAQANLYRPNVVPAPRQVPPVRGNFPKLTPAAGFQPGHQVPPANQVSPRQVAPGTPATHGIHATPGRVPAGEFRSGPPHPATRATQPRPVPGSPEHRVITPAQRQPQERYQRQRQPQELGRRQQPQQQQVHLPQTPRQPQVHRQPQTQELQRRRPPQVRQQQIPQRQPQQYQRAQQQQIRTQPAPQPQPRVQPRPQPQQRQHQQQQRRRQPHEEQ